MEIVKILKVIVANPQTHARWLNSLSYLEYRGFRKIVRSRSTEEMSFGVLMHTSEEIRHSLFFKKQAIRIGGSNFDRFGEETLLCSKALKSYFFEIDANATSAIGGVDKELLSDGAYSLVTWLVEKRAMSLYQIYDELLKLSSAQFSLSSVIKEESLHLKKIGEDAQCFLANNGFNATVISEIEEVAFGKLWSLIGSIVLNAEVEVKTEIAT